MHPFSINILRNYNSQFTKVYVSTSYHLLNLVSLSYFNLAEQNSYTHLHCKLRDAKIKVLKNFVVNNYSLYMQTI